MSIHHTECYVVLDSGFCVQNALISLKNYGINEGALIKKHQCWPALVAGDAMDDYFAERRLGMLKQWNESWMVYAILFGQ